MPNLVSDQEYSSDTIISKLLKHWQVSYTFSILLRRSSKRGIAIAQETPIRELDKVEIDDSFFKRLTKLKLPDKLSKWEKDYRARLGPDLEILKDTFLSSNEQPGGESFDETLYRLFVRKVFGVFALEESKQLFFIKLDRFCNLKLGKSDYDKGDDPSNMPDASFDVNVYLVLKRTGTVNEFSSVVTLCALVEPCYSERGHKKVVQSFLTLAKKSYLTSMDATFNIKDVEAFSDVASYLEAIQAERASLDDIMLYAFVKKFEKLLNKESNLPESLDCIDSTKIKGNYVRRTKSLTSWTLTIDSFEKFTVDPLSNFSSSSLNQIEAHALGLAVIRLLYPTFLYGETEVNQQKYPASSLAEMTKGIRTTLEGDATTYIRPGRRVVLMDYAARNNEFAKSIEEYEKGKSLEAYDYNLDGPRWSPSWNMLMDALVSSQQLVFVSYNAIISKTEQLSSNQNQSVAASVKNILQQGIRDFEEFYNVEVVQRPSVFEQEYEMTSEVNNVSYYYQVLKEKLGLYIDRLILDESQSIASQTRDAVKDLRKVMEETEKAVNNLKDITNSMAKDTRNLYFATIALALSTGTLLAVTILQVLHV